MAQKGGAHAGGSKKGGMILVFAVIIIILVGVVIFLLLRNGSGNTAAPEPSAGPRDTVPTPRSIVATQDNVEEVAEDFFSKPYVAPGHYTVTMNNEWHFAKGNAVSGNAYVKNLEENTNDVYFDVVLAQDEDRVILSSPVIPRGLEWKDISLDTPLDAGTYDCVMIYHLIDENQNTVSTVRVGLTIVVES